MEYLIDYGMFLAKALTIVLAIIVVLTAVASSSQKQLRGSRKGSLKVTRLNDHLEEMRDALRQKVLAKNELKRLRKDEKKQRKAERKAAPAGGGDTTEEQIRRPRLYVINFRGNIPADAVVALREEVTAVLSMAESSDSVLLRLESPGGMVNAYGLAASQLMRFKNAQVPLTICVDKVAASGGYMMACLADRLVAAPFAIIGSIGVLVQLPNFHRVLKKHDVDFEMISAGEYKRTLTSFGEITQKGRDKVQEDVDNIHELFKSWVKEHRPSIEIDRVATGETWVGMQAKERYMVDEIRTSDECIVAACEEHDVFEVEYEIKKTLQDRLGRAISVSLDSLYTKLFERSSNDSYQ